MDGTNNTETNGNEESIKNFWNHFKSSILFLKQFVWDILDLSHGVDKLSVIKEISNNKSMSGANAWMLMASIVIASIGLDLNSPAVIIGAMLISPLMAPILGLGLGAGINDRETIRKSLFHFAVALFIAISTSTIYFLMTPFGEVTDQIATRTEPGPLDILIAFFGGIAGIISYARKDLSTTIPGVAIATALMPPLCVTGFGIAQGEWSIALSSFYLFFLNTFFVTVATYVMVRFLRFPYRKYVNRKERIRNTLFTMFFSLLAAVPGFMIVKSVLDKQNLNEKIELFIADYIGDDQIYLDEYTTNIIDSTNVLILKVYGNVISEDSLPKYSQGLQQLGLYDWDIMIIPTTEVALDQVKSLETKLTGLEKISTQYDVVIQQKEEQSVQIEDLIRELSLLKLDSSAFAQICAELKILHPEIEEVSFGNIQRSDFEQYDPETPVLLIRWSGYRNSTIRQKEAQIEAFVKTRLQRDELLLVPLE